MDHCCASDHKYQQFHSHKPINIKTNGQKPGQNIDNVKYMWLTLSKDSTSTKYIRIRPTLTVIMTATAAATTATVAVTVMATVTRIADVSYGEISDVSTKV